MEEIKISVITVCMNSEETLERTVQSVLTQTWENIEFVLIDGVSRDATVSLYKRLTIGREVVVICEPDNGIYDAYNKGISAASGDVLFFLNSDDYLCDESALSKIAHVFATTECSAVCGGTLQIDSDGNVFRSWMPRSTGRKPFFRQLPQPSLFFRATALTYENRLIHFDPSYKIAADLKLQLEMHRNPSVQFGFLNTYITCMALGGTSTASLAAYVTGWIESRRAFNEVYGFGGAIYTVKKVVEKVFELNLSRMLKIFR